MTLLDFKERAFRILTDMCDSIRYVPNRDADLVSLMKNYLNAESSDRPQILKQIRCCLDGEPYSQPNLGHDYYTNETVDKVGETLSKFYQKVLCANGNTEAIGRTIEDVVSTLNDLNTLSSCGLVDTYRRDLLCALISDTAADFGYCNPQKTINKIRTW